MTRPVKTHAFRGVRYEIIHGRDVDGFVQAPDDDPTLFIQSGLSPRRELETCLHEGIHAEEPRMTEARVDRIAKSLTRWLWRLGYRRPPSR